MKVGDKVLIKEDPWFGTTGKTGTLVWYDESDKSWLVDVNEYITGHNGSLHAPKEISEKYDNSCLFYDEIQFIEEN